MVTNETISSLLTDRRVLITGGLGFVGSNLALRCVKAGSEVAIYDNLDPNGGGNRNNIAEITNDVTCIDGDINDYDFLTRHTAGHDIIFNCAARTSHSLSMSDPWADLNVNVHGVINLLEACRVNNPSVQLVHLGTTTQFGALRFSPATEEHPEFPLDVYSANKVTAEKYIRLYSHAYDLNANVIRLPNLYGPRAAIHRPDLTFNNFFIGLAAQQKPITVFPPGSQIRNILFIDDAVNAIIMSLTCDKSAGGVFLVAGNKHYSVLEIAECIAAEFGSSVRSIPWPIERSITEVGDVFLDDSRFRNATGWRPTIDFPEGLKLTREYLTSRLAAYLPNYEAS